MFEPENHAKICTEHLPRLYDSFVRLRLQSVPEFDSNQDTAIFRRTMLRWLRFCNGKLDSRLVEGIVSPLLQRSVRALGSPPQGFARIEIDQSQLPSVRLDAVFSQMARFRKRDLLHDGPVIMAVRYVGSESRGAGNLKDLIDRVVQDVVDPSYGLFIPTYQGSPVAVPSPSATDEGALAKFRSLGQLMGMAHSLGVVVGLPFAKSVLAMIQMIRPSLLTYDELMAFWTKADSPIQNLLLHYQADYPDKYAMITSGNMSGMQFDLQDRAVAEDSPEERRAYLIDQMLSDTVVSMHAQVLSLVAGFYDVAPFPLLSFYGVEQLKAILSVSNTVINRTDLKNSASYSNDASEEVIGWFWDIVENDLSDAQMAGLLKFISGSRYPPIGGFTGMNGDKKWISIRYDPNEKDWPPVAHTCFQGVALTNYSSREVLKELILLVANYDGLDHN